MKETTKRGKKRTVIARHEKNLPLKLLSMGVGQLIEKLHGFVFRSHRNQRVIFVYEIREA